MVSWKFSSPESNIIDSDEVLCCSRDDDVYEITSETILKPENEVKGPSSLKAKAYANCFCVAIDFTLFIFDSTLKSVLCNRAFECEIDGFDLIENDSVIGIGFKNGCFSCFSLKENKHSFQGHIDVCAEENLPTFTGIHYNGQDSFLLVGRTGSVYRAPISHLLSSGDDVKFECLWELKNEIYSSCSCWNPDGSLNLILGGASKIYRHSNGMTYSKAICTRDKSVHIKKIQASSDDSLIICHLGEKLLFYCAYTLICLKVFDQGSVKDFTLVENMEEEELVLITMSDESGKQCLKLMNIIDFSCRLQSDVKSPILVDSPFFMEKLIFLEELAKDNMKNQSAVVVKCIYESNPLERLKHLLKKNLFKEADEFATKNGLDSEEIYKAQFQQCMEVLQSDDAEEKLAKESHLTSLLAKIKDVEFIVESILSMKQLNVSLMKSLLSTCIEKLELYSGENAIRKDILLKRVSQHLYLLDTFSVLWPNDEKKWESFLKSSILDIFNENWVNEAWLKTWMIWERHWEQCLEELGSVDQVVVLLEKLPLGTFVEELYLILKAVIPKVIVHFPNASSAITRWTIDRVMYFETYDNWAEVALAFAQNMFSYLDYSAKYGENDIILTQQFTAERLKCNWDSLHSLYNVIESLKDIKYFKSEFGIEIKLSDYDQEQKEHLVGVLLWKISDVRDYNKLFTGFLMKYFIKYQMNSDEVLKGVIEDFLCSSSQFWSENLSSSVNKAVALTDFIKDAEAKGRCILKLMKTATLPWDEKLSELVKAGALLDHKISETIRQQLNLMNVMVTLKKYNLESCNIIQDFQMIVKHIIKVGNSDMVQDCLNVASSEAKKEEVYTRCAEHYIEKREYERAFSLLKSLPKAVCVATLQRVVHGIHAASLFQGLDSSNTSYISILKLIEMHLIDVLKDTDEEEYILEEIPLKKLKGDYFIMKYLDSESHAACMEVEPSSLNEILSKFIGRSCISANDILVNVKKLSEAFHCKGEEILMMLLGQIDDEAISMALTKQLLLSITEDGTEIDILGSILSSILNLSLKEDNGRDIQKLLWKNLARCNARDQPIIIELCRFFRLWIPNTQATELLNSNSASSFLPLTSNALRIPPKAMQSPPLNLLQGAVLLEKNRHLWFHLLSKVPSVKDFNAEFSKDLPFNQSQGEYQSDGLVWLGFQVDFAIAWDHELLGDIEEFKSLSTQLLLKRTASHKELDISLMVGLLSCFNESSMLHWINYSMTRSKDDILKVHSLSNLAVILCDMYNLPEKAAFYMEICLKCIVDKRIIEMGIPIDGLTGNISQIQKDILLKKVMDSKSITATDLEEICFLYDLDVQEMFLEYLEHLLLSWTPEYTVKVLLNGQEEIIIMNDGNEILKAFTCLSPRINVEALQQFLKDVWGKINFYYYEVYEVILEVMITMNAEVHFVIHQKDMIRFLKNYHRVSPPSSAELDVFDDLGSLPEIAKWRLPLLTNSYKCTEEALPSQNTHFSFAGSLVDAEVNFQNYAKWLKAPRVSGRDDKLICGLAIKHGVKMHLNSCNDSNDWQLYPSNNNFLQCVKECAMLMKSPKYATAAVKYIVTKLPQGIDQLIATKLCLSLAQIWVKSGEHPEEAKSILKKVQNKYSCLSVKHILYKYGFGQPKYLDMISYPEDLIASLYYDATNFESSVLAKEVGGLCSAADEISKLFAINLEELKLKLISKWISPKDEKVARLDISCIGEVFASEGKFNSAALDEELRRILHVCKSMDDSVMQHLVSIAFPNDGSFNDVSTLVKLKTALCIYELDHKHAEKLYALKGISDMGAYIKKLYLLLQLESLGIVCSLEEYESLDTKSLVNNILSQKSLYQTAVSLAAKLCLATGVYNHTLWSTILKSMIQSSMFQELTKLLPLLRVHCSFIAVEKYRDAWREVLEGPFVKANYPLTYEEGEKCRNSLQLLHLCPFLCDINLNEIFHNCLRLHQEEMAAILLPFFQIPLRKQLKEKIYSTVPDKELMPRLQNLSSSLQICYSSS